MKEEPSSEGEILIQCLISKGDKQCRENWKSANKRRYLKEEKINIQPPRSVKVRNNIYNSDSKLLYLNVITTVLQIVLLRWQVTR